jgi:hypothetical protein
LNCTAVPAGISTVAGVNLYFSALSSMTLTAGAWPVGVRRDRRDVSRRDERTERDHKGCEDDAR